MIKFILAVAIFIRSFCVFAKYNNSEKINWPANNEPSESKFYVHNEIEINARPEVVWSYLIDALKWPFWYIGAKNVSFINSNDTVLKSTSILNWEAMGLKFQSTIKQFEANSFLA